MHRDPGSVPFRIGRWRVDPHRNLISRGRRTTAVEPRVMRVLVALAESAPMVVSRDALQQVVWADVVVTPNSLTNAISDLRRAFGEDAADPRVIETVRGAGYRLAVPVRMKRHWGRPISRLAAVGAVATVVLGLGFGLLDRKPVSDAPHLLTNLTTLPGVELDPKFSPDGGRVAFVWFDSSGRPADIYVKSRVNGRATRVTTAPGAELSPAWSPDGAQLAFVSNDGTCHLNTVPASGGAATRLVELGCGRTGLAWSPDGLSIAFVQQERAGGPGAIHTIDLASRETTVLTTPGATGLGDYAPKYAPGGAVLSFLRSSVAGASDLYTVDPATGETKRQTFTSSIVSGYDWAADGHSILIHTKRDGLTGLWRLSRDATGPELVRASADVDAGSISVDRRSGDVVFASWRYDIDLWRSDLASAAPPQKVSASTTLDAFPALAPTGDSLAFVSARSGTAEIWVADVRGNGARQLTRLGHNALRNVAWAPDGSSLLFESVHDGRTRVCRATLPSGSVLPLVQDAANPTWSLDGTAILYTAHNDSGGEIRRYHLTSGVDERVLDMVSYGAREIESGAILFTRRDDTGLWRADLSREGPPVLGRVVENTAGKELSSWSLIGGDIYYLRRPNLASDYDVMRVDAGGDAHRVASIPTEIVSPFQRFGFALAPDDNAIYYGHLNPPESDLVVLERS